MEGMNLIALSIPIFFILIGVELLVARHEGRKVYRLNDSINDLNLGTLQQILGVFSKVVVFGAYLALYEAWHLFEIPQGSAPTWVLCFLGVDFFYYWFHRVSHEVNLPWGAHIVHHSSEEYNLTVALRQGAFQPLFSWIFYLPLALLGFPPLIFLACSSLNTLYQFWIHTRLIGKLGFLEWFLNTPSHHRVHHGCDAKYIDKNYAGTLIVWDRLFGTFQVEEEEPTYGLTKPLASWNPLWANVHYYSDLIRAGRHAPSWREKIRLWFLAPAAKPDWAEQGLGTPSGTKTPLTDGEAGKYDTRAPRRLGGYVLVQYGVIVLLTLYLLYRGADLSWWGRAGVALLIAWTATNLGGIFERRRWLLYSEPLRLGALWGAGIAMASELGTASAVAAAAGGALLAGFFASWVLARRDAFRGATAGRDQERMESLRRGIADLCQVLDVEWTETRRAVVEAMGLAELEALRERLVRARTW